MEPGGPRTFVLKRHRYQHPEPYEREKLHASIVSACLSSGAPTGYSEHIARRVVDEVEEWLAERPEVTTDDIRRITARFLRTYHPDASYLYEHHRSTL